MRISKGYHGSVVSAKFETLWKSELKNNPQLFITKTIKTFSTRKDALQHEHKLHLHFCVIKNPLYINEANAFGPKSGDPWNKGKHGLQTPWNKGKKGVQVAWNKGLANPSQSSRMKSQNPMHDPDVALKVRQTKLQRDLQTQWSCVECGKTRTVENIVHNIQKKFCNHSCSASYHNRKRSIK